MIDLYGSQITQILPDYFSQMAEVKSLSYAVSQAVKRLIKYCRNIGVYSQVEYLTEDMLDMLAVELDTQHYDNSLSLETKRKIIKNTLVWYMSAGTPSAVEELVETVFGEGKVTEWFEYADDPYYFKIQTNALMTQDIIYEFTRLLQKAKMHDRISGRLKFTEPSICRTILENVFFQSIGQQR